MLRNEHTSTTQNPLTCIEVSEHRLLAPIVIQTSLPSGVKCTLLLHSRMWHLLGDGHVGITFSVTASGKTISFFAWQEPHAKECGRTLYVWPHIFVATAYTKRPSGDKTRTRAHMAHNERSYTHNIAL